MHSQVDEVLLGAQGDKMSPSREQCHTVTLFHTHVHTQSPHGRGRCRAGRVGASVGARPTCPKLVTCPRRSLANERWSHVSVRTSSTLG
jgi:hypothetical protein